MIRYMEGTWYQFRNEIVFERPFKRILEWNGIWMVLGTSFGMK